MVAWLWCTSVMVDGEPWEQHPATITLVHHNQATMLANDSDY